MCKKEVSTVVWQNWQKMPAGQSLFYRYPFRIIGQTDNGSEGNIAETFMVHQNQS
jgi:hypothetical protein